mmetsp:Transcript_10066/g.24017  ORF Transcript_10066/g.24017 Transcript_10066/m.24017 type:complete len:262 (+) Transcript_10066:1582-2367(+)
MPLRMEHTTSQMEASMANARVVLPSIGVGREHDRQTRSPGRHRSARSRRRAALASRCCRKNRWIVKAARIRQALRQDWQTADAGASEATGRASANASAITGCVGSATPSAPPPPTSAPSIAPGRASDPAAAPPSMASALFGARTADSSILSQAHLATMASAEDVTENFPLSLVGRERPGWKLQCSVTRCCQSASELISGRNAGTNDNGVPVPELSDGHTLRKKTPRQKKTGGNGHSQRKLLRYSEKRLSVRLKNPKTRTRS